MQTITASLSAGVKQVFSVPDARFFMLLETESSLDVELFDLGGNRSELSIGVESGYREKAESDQHLIGRVELTSATAQDVKFGYSQRDADNRKVTSTVSIVSGEKEATLGGGAFIGGAYRGATAAQYSHIQLWNPVAAPSGGKRLVVDEVTFTSSVAGPIGLYLYATALATAAGNDCVNKLAGGAISDGLLKTDSLGALTGTLLEVGACRTNDLAVFDLKTPIILPPEYGLIVANRTVNTEIYANFQFTEIPE